MAKNGLKPLKKLGDPKVKNSNPKPVRVIREDKAPYKRETYPETWRAMDRHFGLRPKPAVATVQSFISVPIQLGMRLLKRSALLKNSFLVRWMKLLKLNAPMIRLFWLRLSKT
jgi:hypothetical protein